MRDEGNDIYLLRPKRAGGAQDFLESTFVAAHCNFMQAYISYLIVKRSNITVGMNFTPKVTC